MLAAGLAVQLLFLVAAVAAVYLLYRAIHRNRRRRSSP